VDTRAFVKREGALVEVTLDGLLRQIVAAEPPPADQIVRRDEDIAFAALATRAAARTVEGLARLWIDGAFDGSDEVGIERSGCQGRPHPRRVAASCQFEVSQNPRPCE
jgi:hypothetical protein